MRSTFRAIMTNPDASFGSWLEYGTLGHSLEKQIEGLNSFLLEHQGRFYGYATPELERAILNENFARSYPESDEWRTQILSASRETLKRVFARIKESDQRRS